MDRNPIIIKSKITGIEYNDNESVHIWNALQAYKFMLNGAVLVDIFPSISEEKLCFVFSRKDFEIMQPLWIDRKL